MSVEKSCCQNQKKKTPPPPLTDLVLCRFLSLLMCRFQGGGTTARALCVGQRFLAPQDQEPHPLRAHPQEVYHHCVRQSVRCASPGEQAREF